MKELHFESGNQYFDVIFSDLKIDGEKFEEIDCTKCVFKNCNFSDGTFKVDVFEKCEFFNCDLSNVTLENTKFNSCEFTDCKMIGINWVMSLVPSIRILCIKCDLSYSYFPQMKLSKSEFVKCKLMESDFSEANCHKVIFRGSNLKNATFRSTDLSEADFRKAINYMFHPQYNNLKKAKFSQDTVHNLMKAFGAIVEWD